MTRLWKLKGTLKKTNEPEEIFVIAESVEDVLVSASTFAIDLVDCGQSWDLNQDWSSYG